MCQVSSTHEYYTKIGLRTVCDVFNYLLTDVCETQHIIPHSVAQTFNSRNNEKNTFLIEGEYTLICHRIR